MVDCAGKSAEGRAYGCEAVVVRPTVIAWTLALATAFVGAPAGAAESVKQQCTHAAERAQQYRLDGKLLSSQKELHVCLRAACPAVIKSHCTKWFEEVDAALPSVVVRVRDDSGVDLPDATVTADGAPLANWRSGMPLPLDPGEHAFQYSRPGNVTQKARVLLGTGEKNRVLAVTLAAVPTAVSLSPAPAPDTAAAAASRPDEHRASHHGPSAATWVVGGVAVTAFAGFAYFAATGDSDLRTLRSGCGVASRCAQSDVDAAWRKLVFADVSLGVGILATGIATWLFFGTRGSSSDAPEAAPASVGTLRVVPTLRGGGVVWDARF